MSNVVVMLPIFPMRFIALFVVISTSPTFVSTGDESPSQKNYCHFGKHRLFYYPNASHSQWTVTRGFTNANETECSATCCSSSNLCMMYLFSNNSTLHNSSNCLLISCRNKSGCLTNILPGNASSIPVVVGLKDLANRSLFNSSIDNISNKQFKTISSLPNQNTITQHNLIVSRSTDIHHFPPLNGTPTLNSMTQLSSTHTGSTLNVVHGNTHTVESSKTTLKQSGQATLFLNHTLHIHLGKPSPSSSQKGLSTRSFTGSTLDNSLNNATPLLISISEMFPSLDVPSSSVDQMMIMNALKFSPFLLRSTALSSSPTSTSVITTSSIPSDVLDKANIAASITPSQNLSSSLMSSVKQKPKGKTFSERSSHTTPASLVIALIIGILFFGAVVFLIGRRWAETCFRRGYSHVDYLLNDYD